MTDEPICPCEEFEHPKLIRNPPGRERLDYRAGDYLSFRHALQLSLTGETELNNWKPSASGDLALQLIEWWAYLSDILTFYNERIANESYLRTATLPESIHRLIRALGYRPRPGIGAAGYVAALLTGSASATLPEGFQIQSKPGPGKQPQVFELDEETVVEAPDAVAVDPPPSASTLHTGSLLVKGIVGVKAGDKLLVMKKNWNGTDAKYALGTVTSAQEEKDPRGKTNTRVTISYHRTGLASTDAVTNFRLLKSTQEAHPWPYTTANDNVVIKSTDIELDSVTRLIKVGDPVLIENTAVATSGQLVSVTAYTEIVWNANTSNGADPTRPPAATTLPTAAIPIPHTSLTFTPALQGAPPVRQQALVRFGWVDVGELIASPAKTFTTTLTTLSAVAPASLPASTGMPVILEDAEGAGALTTSATSGSPPTSLQLESVPSVPATLAPPLRALLNVLAVSRGKTVPREILGSGDATVAGQEFVLQKSPLTYLLSASSTSGENYQSTLRVWVDGIEWKEVASFYAQPKDAQVFVTYEDQENKTHVLFGDGINGARLTTGVNNILARYRYGSGEDSPDAGSLTVILQPQPNLKKILNPVAVGGGSEPDPPDQIRRYAPRSILTFGRAVSADDYETIAAQTPGVAGARSYWAWDAIQQRTLVKIYVGDDSSAVSAAKVALSGAADPNRPVLVQQATAIPVTLSLSLRLDPRFLPANVVADVRAALIDEEAGLFGAGVIRIGQSIYESQIYAVCLSVAGVVAVHALQFTSSSGTGLRYEPGEGGFYQLLDENLTVSTEGT